MSRESSLLRRAVSLSAAVALLGWTVSFADGRAAPPPATTEIMSLGLRGVHFVPNHGQWEDEAVHIGFKSCGLDVAFRESSLTMHLRREKKSDSPKPEHSGSHLRIAQRSPWSPQHGLPARAREESSAPADPTRGFEDSTPGWEHLTLEVSFPGSNAVLPRAAGPQVARFNYFIGDDESRWASDVPSYGMIVYENLYKGIDLHVMAAPDARGVLKYEFYCAPGADYTQIRIHYDGIDSLCVNADGDLDIATTFGMLRDGAPIVWHEQLNERQGAGTATAAVDASFSVANGRDAAFAEATNQRGTRASDISVIPARFEICDARTYRIALNGPIDPTRPLIIDPEIAWMYYLGGSGGDWGGSVVVDSAGNALVAGGTGSIDFAGRTNLPHGDGDAFALKVSPSGQLLWMTYLGGGHADGGNDIAVDSAGNALVTGITSSTDFAGRTNSPYGRSDAFALKVSPSGQLLWMTYLGGSEVDEGLGITVDSAGNAMVAGGTDSADFAGRNNSFHGVFDAFVLKLSPSGELSWMTFLGGSSDDVGFRIAADSTDNALMAGVTISTDFSGRNNSMHGEEADAFALKVSHSGQVLWMTFLGGSDWEMGVGIAVDSTGNSLVTGTTGSTNFAGRNNSFHGVADGFALKVNASGQILWMTYLGGSEWDAGEGIAIDAASNALVTGYTASANFAGRNNSQHGSNTDDAFALKVSPAGQILWMMYLGGSESDSGSGIAVDSAGNALVTGGTWSTDYEGRVNSHYGGDIDAFLVKLRIPDGPQLSIAPTCPSGGPIRIEWSGATPGGHVALIFARNTGSFIIPSNMPCAGTQLALGSDQIQLAWEGSAGPSGSRTLNATAGPAACGGHLQLLDLSPCATSNLVRIE